MPTTTIALTGELKVHDPGIYFGLDEDAYHADPALGSSDVRRLAKNPADYWWNSWMNPMAPESRETDSLIRGSAVHALVLYGEAEFDRRYMRGAVHSSDMTPAEKASLTKAANAKAAARGLQALRSDRYDNIVLASAMISRNPKLATALTGGLNEVSIFWTDMKNGIRKKARIDCLKPRGVGDLKSLVNKYEKPFPQACISSIKFYRYDVQAYHYLEARKCIARFVAAGAVHGDHDTALLKAIAASQEYAWQFVFWQAEGAPVTWSKTISPDNPLLEISKDTADKADANFLDYSERFGREMWLLEEETTELYVDEMGPSFGLY